MNSPSKRENHELKDNEMTPLTSCDMSPVTNLTHNLKGLSTAGTPSRRISWSNPFPNESPNVPLMPNMSPYIDSPTFQENVLNKRKARAKILKKRTHFSSDSDEDKENCANLVSSVTRLKCDSASSMEYDSQDSGYSCLMDASLNNSLINAIPELKVKSSLSAEDEDSLENLFGMEDFDVEPNSVPDTFTNLLTKPIHPAFQSSNCPTAKKSKPPIRRCLSMEMNRDSSSQFREAFSQKGTYIAASSPLNEIDAEFETTNRCTFKRPDPPGKFSFQNKRRKSSASEESNCNFVFKRCYSETAASIMHALQKAEMQPELIGDCSKSFALPLVKGRHQDLKCISPQTLVEVMNGSYDHEISAYTLVDCRYPYEYEGGHIRGAKNIFTKEDILETFLKAETAVTSARNIIIFHCEFSSERAPNLCRFLRNKDREKNEGSYPRLSHPEVYILEGGYKVFFELFKEYCEPQDYKPMNHKDHGFDLRHFRAKSKSWGADSKLRLTWKTTTKHQLM